MVQAHFAPWWTQLTQEVQHIVHMRQGRKQLPKLVNYAAPDLMAIKCSWSRAPTTSARVNGPPCQWEGIDCIRENVCIAEVSCCGNATAVAVRSNVVILSDADTMSEAGPQKKAMYNAVLNWA